MISPIFMDQKTLPWWVVAATVVFVDKVNVVFDTKGTARTTTASVASVFLTVSWLHEVTPVRASAAICALSLMRALSRTLLGMISRLLSLRAITLLLWFTLAFVMVLSLVGESDPLKNPQSI